MITLKLKDILKFIDSKCLLAIFMPGDKFPMIVFWGRKEEVMLAPSDFPMESLMDTQIVGMRAEMTMNWAKTYINITILHNEEVSKWQLRRLSGQDEQE